MSQSGTFASSGGGGGGSGTPVQQARTSTSAIVTTTDAVGPASTPTTANTALLMSLTVTPTSATNTLIFESWAPGNCNVFANLGLYLFAGNTLLATAASCSGTGSSPVMAWLYFEAVSGTTSATTYTIRFADATGSGGTTTVNSDGSGNTYGGSLTSFFVITEVMT